MMGCLHLVLDSIFFFTLNTDLLETTGDTDHNYDD